ncbi:MAG: TVP38/TMEM64 family protein [Mycobacteriaceae bacterium]
MGTRSGHGARSLVASLLYLLGLAALVVAIIAAVVVLPTPELATIRDSIEDAGAWAPVAYLVLMVITTLLPFPRTVWTVAAGVIFGPVLGSVLALAGMALSALLSMVLVRWIGGPAVRRAERNPRVRGVQELLEQRGWVCVLALRMIPVIPFAPLNYACGLSRVPFLPCLLASVAGSAPLTVVAVLAADAVVSDSDPIVLVIGVLVAGAGLLLVAREAVHVRAILRVKPSP